MINEHMDCMRLQFSIASRYEHNKQRCQSELPSICRALLISAAENA